MTAGAGPDGRARSFGWRLGVVAGIPVYLGRSWPVIALIVVVGFGPQVRSSTGATGGTFGYAVALAYAGLLLVSVLAHEAAHAVVARRVGYRVDRIVADLWGGHTVYDSSSARPGGSAAIAVAGPLANLLLAAVGFGLQLLVDGGVVGLLLGALTLTNLFVGVFNLLPGLPLDGGFLVDALVWKVTGDRNRGLIVAGRLGRILTVALVLWFVGRPLLLGQQPSLFTIVWIGLIGAFLWVGATSAIRSGTSRRLIESVPLTRVLRPAVVVPATASIADALAPVPSGAAVVVADGAGRAVGLVDQGAVRGIDPAQWPGVPVDSVTVRQPDGWVVVVPSRDVDVSQVITALVARSHTDASGAGMGPSTLLVVTAAAPGVPGEVLGVVTVTDLNAALSGH